jgi:D-alanine-D-alanine ligase
MFKAEALGGKSVKTRLCVLFGGASTEHRVSRRSASKVLPNIDETKYEIIPVGITEDGRWIYYAGHDWNAVLTGEWENDAGNLPAAISPDTGVHGLTLPDGKTMRVDVIFPILHGKNGEDGTVQGLFELAGIPYVGCGVAASANTMDKAITKLFADREGIPQAKYLIFRREEFFKDPETNVRRTVEALGLPIFVKPARTGSSVGIAKVKTRDALADAVREAGKYDRKIVFEEAIVGQELEVAVFGDCDGRVITSAVGEIVPNAEFYTYAAKYDDEGTLLYIPAHISAAASDALRARAEAIYRAMDCFGMARADFFLRERDGEIIFNEINAIPALRISACIPSFSPIPGSRIRS